MVSLNNKRILITGSTDGLGKLLAIHLSKKGAHITIHGRNEQKTQETLNQLPGEGHSSVVCNFNNLDEVESIFSTIESVDILINNAGIWEEGTTHTTNPERIIQVVNIDLTAHMLVTRILLPVLRESEFGQILNVSSISGVEIDSNEFYTFYAAAKFGIQGFTESLIKEYYNSNLRIMGFYPGDMATSLFGKANKEIAKNESWMFDPQESAEAIEFMLTRNPKVNVKRLDLVNHLED